MESHQLWKSRKAWVGKRRSRLVRMDNEYTRARAGKDKKQRIWQGLRQLTNPETGQAETRPAPGMREETPNRALRRTKAPHEPHTCARPI
jgi:hypothetical protein